MRGLKKKSHGKGTNRHADKQTDGHRDSMKELADSLKRRKNADAYIAKIKIANLQMCNCRICSKRITNQQKKIVAIGKKDHCYCFDITDW